MVRALLLGLLTVSAVASCKGKEGGPAVQVGVAAGKVVELSGSVTARRGAESRALASGNEVSGDDVIETGADSTISIVLAHNNAVWSLGPNKREKVAESMAWSLAKVDKPAIGAVESTSAAGRHAERAGASTSATASDRGDRDHAAPPPPAAGPATATGAAPAAGAPTQAPPSPPASPSPEPRTSKPAKGVLPAPTATAPSDLGDLGGGGGDGAAIGGRRESARPVATSEEDAPPAKRAVESAKDAPAPAAPAPVSSAEVVPEIQVLANRERARLKQCLDTTTPSLAVTLIVEQGKARFKLPAGTAPSVASCLAKVAAEMKPSAGLTANLAVTIK